MASTLSKNKQHSYVNHMSLARAMDAARECKLQQLKQEESLFPKIVSHAYNYRDVPSGNYVSAIQVVTAIHIAAANNCQDILTEYIGNQGYDPDMKRKIKWYYFDEILPSGITLKAQHVYTMDGERTPLVMAMEKGYSNIVAYLVDKGSNVNIQNSLLRTPLILATIAGSIDNVNLLLGYMVDATIIDIYGKTALNYATELGLTAIENSITDYLT